MATPSPKTLAARIKKELRALGKPAVAESMRRFFKSSERVRFMGVKTPDMRKVARGVYNDVKKVWTLADALALADTLVRDPHIEVRSCGLALLARFKKVFEPTMLPTLRGWIETGRLDNWALIDLLSMEVFPPLIQSHPAIIQEDLEMGLAQEPLDAPHVRCVPVQVRAQGASIWMWRTP